MGFYVSHFRPVLRHFFAGTLLVVTLHPMELFAELENKKTNEHLLKVHNQVESENSKTRLLNRQLAPSLNHTPEFIEPSKSDYGVDMRPQNPLPNYSYDNSKENHSLDALIEKDLLDDQNSDFILERDWNQIRKSFRQTINLSR